MLLINYIQISAPNLKGRPRKKKFTSKEKLSHLARRLSEDDTASIPDTPKVEKEKKQKHKSKVSLILTRVGWLLKMCKTPITCMLLFNVITLYSISSVAYN